MTDVPMTEINELLREEAEQRLERLIENAAAAGKSEPDELPEMNALFKHIWDIRGNIHGIPYDAFENDSCPDPISFQPLSRVWRCRRGEIWR
jgi:hypothetical protein